MAPFCIFKKKFTSESLYSTSEDSGDDDDDYDTTTTTTNNTIKIDNRTAIFEQAFKDLVSIVQDSDDTTTANKMLPFAATMMPAIVSSSSSAGKGSNKKRTSHYEQYPEDSRISSSDTAMFGGCALTPAKKRKTTSSSKHSDNPQQLYANAIHATYCMDNAKYSNFNDIMIDNEALYRALMIDDGDHMIATACMNCRNIHNMELLEWSEAVLIQLCDLKRTNLLTASWSDIIDKVEMSQWGLKLVTHLKRTFGQSIRLSIILETNHAMKIKRFGLQSQCVFLKNRIPPVNIPILMAMTIDSKSDLIDVRNQRSLNRLPINIHKKNNVTII